MSATQDKDQTYIYHSSHFKLVVLIVMIATTVASNYEAQVQWKKRRGALFVSGGTSAKVLKCPVSRVTCVSITITVTRRRAVGVGPGWSSIGVSWPESGAVWAQNEIKVLCEEQISYLLIYSCI